MRCTKGIVAYRRGGAGATTPHQRVAAWVAANSSKVLAYYPMSDAAANGTMADESGNGRDGDYNNNVAAGTIDGETVADFTDSIISNANVDYASWMDSITGIFAVIEPDDTGEFQQIISRDDSNATLRINQFRLDTSNRVNYINIHDGNKGTAAGTVGTSRVTVGYWWDGTDVMVYLNGTEVGSVTTIDVSPSKATELQFGYRVGALGNSDPFDGRMGSVVILSGSADSSSIAQLHSAWMSA